MAYDAHQILLEALPQRPLVEPQLLTLGEGRLLAASCDAHAAEKAGDALLTETLASTGAVIGAFDRPVGLLQKDLNGGPDS